MTANTGHVYWPSSVANVVWLWAEGGSKRLGVAGMDAERLVAAVDGMAGAVTELGRGAAGDLGGEARHDVVVAVCDMLDASTVRAMKAVAPGGRLFLLVSHSSVRIVLREFRLQGLVIEFEYWVASSVSRPVHLIPHNVYALEAHLDAVGASGGAIRAIRRVALALGWRPSLFGATLLIASKR